MSVAELQPPQIEQHFATVRQGCHYLNIGTTSIYQMMGDGQLQFTKIRGMRRIAWEELRRVANEGTESE